MWREGLARIDQTKLVHNTLKDPHLPLSVLEAPVKLAPLSLLVLESVLLAPSLMLLFRDRLPPLGEIELALLGRSRMLSFRDRLPLLDPGRANTFLTLSHLVSPFFFGVGSVSVTITRRDSSHSMYSVFGEGSSG